MALFVTSALTKKGQALIAKSEATGSGIKITRAAVGNGNYSDTSVDYLEQRTELINEKKEAEIASKAIVEGNTGLVTILVHIDNAESTETFYVNELGIFAEDPDEGEILYTLIVSDMNTFYMTADSGGGRTLIRETVYLEVVNAGQTTIDTTGALASQADVIALRTLLNNATGNLQGGTAGQVLRKKSSTNYAYQWEDSNTITDKYENFPETGVTNALYVDTDNSAIYVWKNGAYFKLPLGAEASETLQSQITENAESIKSLQSLEDETLVTVPTSGWTQSTSGGVTIYTQNIAVTGMTADTDVTVYRNIISTTASAIVEEMRAAAIFLGNGEAESTAGYLKLTCYGKLPDADFGLMLKGDIA